MTPVRDAAQRSPLEREAELVRFHRLLTRRTTRLWDQEKALGYFTRSLERQPGNHAVRVEYANALKGMGRLQPALANYRIAALQNAVRAVALDATQRLYAVASQLGELDALIDGFRTRVERLPQETSVARVLSEFFIREFDYGQAADFPELILNQNPGDLELRLLRGDLNRRLGRFDAALVDYRRALRLPNIDRDYVLGEIGKVHYEAGRTADARRTWNRIAGKLHAGNLLRNNGFRADAIAALQDGLRARPDSVPLLRQLIDIYETSGKQKKALQVRQRLLDLNPDNRMNIEDLAAAYLGQGNRKKAVEVATRLFSLNPVPQSAGGYSQFAGMSPMLMRLYSMYGSGRGAQNPVAQAVEFFTQRGLTTEMEPIIADLLIKRPKDGLLKQAAAELSMSRFQKPDKALQLMQELETDEFPRDHRPWRGQSTQQRHFRLQRLLAVMTNPAISKLVRKRTNGKGVPSSRIRYATICLFRRRPDEARRAIDEGLNGLKVKPTSLLQFRAMLSILKGERAAAFDDLLAAERQGPTEPVQAFGGRRLAVQTPGLLPLLAKEYGKLAERYVAWLNGRIRKNRSDWSRYKALIEFLKSTRRDREITGVLDRAGKVAAVKQSVLEYRLLEAETRHAAPAKMILVFASDEDGSREDSSSATYQPLYDGYQKLRRSLLLELAQDREFVKATTDAPVRDEERRWNTGLVRYFPGRQSSLSERLSAISHRSPQDSSATEAQLVQDVYQHHRVEWADKLLRKRKGRLHAAERMLAAELAASLGRTAEAERLRRADAINWLGRLKLDDQPNPIPEGFTNPDSPFDLSASNVDYFYTHALNRTAPVNSPAALSKVSIPWSYYHNVFGDSSDLIVMARRDPAVARELEKLAPAIGPGWQRTTFLSLLLRYYEAKRQPREVLALVDRVSKSKLPPAGLLAYTLRAAYAAKEYDRIDRALAEIERRYPRLKPQIALQRIILERHHGNVSKAATLEKSLLTTIPARATRPPSELATLVGKTLAGRQYSNPWWYRNPFASAYRDPDLFGSASGEHNGLNAVLIRGFGLEIPKPESNPLSLADVRRQYAAHGLMRDAVRILDREVAALPKDATSRRWDLLAEKGRLLNRWGKAAEAKMLLATLAKTVEAAAKTSPNSAVEYRLSRLYAMPEFGPDDTQALRHFHRARRLDGRYDRAGLTEGFYLFQSKQDAASSATTSPATTPARSTGRSSPA